MKQYYIISCKHTSGYTLTLWRPNNSGYTIYLEQAGKYSEEDVKKNPLYYNNRNDTIAVPVEELEKIAHHVIPWENHLLKQIGIQI
jgi:hypothetical protein